MNKTNTQLAYARKIDGDGYILFLPGGMIHKRLLQGIPFRWIEKGSPEEQFQVYYRGYWRNCSSIDFEFK